jgi:hypothetical protein
VALEELILEDLEQGRQVGIAGAEGDVRDRLERLDVIDVLPSGHVRPSKQVALDKAEALLGTQSSQPRARRAAAPVWDHGRCSGGRYIEKTDGSPEKTEYPTLLVRN